MNLIDVNVLVYASRMDLPDHDRYREWLEDVVSGDAAYCAPELALSGFLRIVTHPKLFATPTPLVDALKFVAAVRSGSSSVVIAPGDRHFGIFVNLVERTNAKGNAVPDAYFAALAIESGSTWITTDTGFGRFPGLDWKHPFDAAG